MIEQFSKVNREIADLSGAAFFSFLMTTALPLIVAMDATSDSLGSGTAAKCLLAVAIGSAATLSRRWGLPRAHST